MPTPSAEPLVSCLMVTRDRPHLAERAVHCFARQTWQCRELVIIDDGDVDYSAMLAPFQAAGALIR
jgi:glycosyltransferase involved in cell wall biosynthesis